MDWVEARLKWSVEQMWSRLVQQLTGDVNIWNTKKAAVEQNPEVSIEEVNNGKSVLIIAPFTSDIYDRVRVDRREKDLAIVVKGVDTFKLVPMLNRNGEARVLCATQELELWQASRFILEPLLFGTVPPAYLPFLDCDAMQPYRGSLE